MSSEMLPSMAGIQLNPIPFKSGPAAVTDFIGRQVNSFTADFGVKLIAYFAVFAPAGTPAEVIAKLNAAINAGANSKDIQDRFSATGLAIDPATPEDLARRNTAEAAKWEKAIKGAKIEPQ